jgi:hypothetical protein
LKFLIHALTGGAFAAFPQEVLEPCAGLFTSTASDWKC